MLKITKQTKGLRTNLTKPRIKVLILGQNDIIITSV